MRGKATPSGEANPPAREYATSETPASPAQREAQPRKTAGTKNAKIADSAEGADSLEKLQDAIHGPDAPSRGNGTYQEPAKPTVVAGDMVSLHIPGPNGPMKVGGKVVKDLGDGRVEVRTQQHGYAQVPASEVQPWAKTPAPNKSSAAVDEAIDFPKVPSPSEIKEARRIVHELDAMPYTDRLLKPSEKGNSLEHVPGTGGAGAKVYDDIMQMAPGTSKITRGKLQKELEAYLAGGKMTNAVKGALEIAKLRASGAKRIPGDGPLSSPELPPSAGDVPTRLERK